MLRTLFHYNVTHSIAPRRWSSSPQARVGRREVTWLEVHGHRPGRALACRWFLGDGRHRLAVPERRTGRGGGGRGAGRGGQLAVAALTGIGSRNRRRPAVALQLQLLHRVAFLLLQLTVLLQRVAESRGRQQAAATGRYGPGHRGARTVVARVLLLLLLLLRVLLVPVGHAKTAKVHQPAGVRAVVLRLGTRQVVVACNICNTCTRARSNQSTVITLIVHDIIIVQSSGWC